MDKFREAYNTLNSAQKAAVNSIDGPVLVVAGPGTGKTQLLSARIANILQKTDTPARNILCLTFTENGAQNMRDRLSSLLGQTAYDITISTYHAFGSELIRRFPEHFAEIQKPLDELDQRQIFAGIVETISFANPLKQSRHHIHDLMSSISDIKRALLSSDDLRAISAENLSFLDQSTPQIQRILAGFTRMPSVKNALPLFGKVLKVLSEHTPSKPVSQRFGSTAQIAKQTLQAALDEASAINKTTPITNWKNNWLIKDNENQFTLVGTLENKRLTALADMLDQYQQYLKAHGLYDYDDMIIEPIKVLEDNDDFRFTLQEQYLYILLDEFQDTNATQLRLIQLLTNNPVSEGRPNVLAVGDDDQAIYAFQGAQYSNMLDFYKMYRGVRVINLTENYRSHGDIILTAQNVVEQIDDRVYKQFDRATKTLKAASHQLPPQATIDRYEFLSDIAQASWIAEKVRTLISRGIAPREIAILAPRHRKLEQLVPYLNAVNVPVRYEKREDILEAAIIKQLLAMSRLVLALHDNDGPLADSLWPEVLSYDFWQLPISSIWKVAWKVADERQQHNSAWSRALLAEGEQFRMPALLFLTLATKVDQETCETMLDYLIGTATLDTNEPDLPQICSPLRDYETNPSTRQTKPERFYETLTYLIVLRSRLRDHQLTQEAALDLRDLVHFVDMYKDAGEPMESTNPYNQHSNAVQVMTTFKAKGLEFEHVFLPSLQDDVWGNASHGQANRLALPANLAPIRHAGATEDERLRILFVAITRAKLGLHLTNVTQTYSGKATKRLKYLNEREQEDGSIRDLVLPTKTQIVQQVDITPPLLEQLEREWRQRHTEARSYVQLKDLLHTRLEEFQLSPTHLTTFLDLQYGGPERFFFANILRFPQAPTTDSQFGSAIHETLEWVQLTMAKQKDMPPLADTIAYFSSRLSNKRLSKMHIDSETQRGRQALTAFLTERSHTFNPEDKTEFTFKNEGVFVSRAHLAGKVDHLEIDKQNKTVTVVDYKTGKSFSQWQSEPKLHHYRRQLYCYKILVENSQSFAGYHVDRGRLEFIEPDKNNRINTLELAFSDEELVRTKQLITAIWQHIRELDFPNIQAYDASLAGIRQFENALIEGKI